MSEYNYRRLPKDILIPGQKEAKNFSSFFPVSFLSSISSSVLRQISRTPEAAELWLGSPVMSMCCNKNNAKVQVQQQTHSSSLLKTLSFPLELTTHLLMKQKKINQAFKMKMKTWRNGNTWWVVLFTILLFYKQINVLFIKKEMFNQRGKLGYSVICTASQALLALIK